MPAPLLRRLCATASATLRRTYATAPPAQLSRRGGRDGRAWTAEEDSRLTAAVAAETVASQPSPPSSPDATSRAPTNFWVRVASAVGGGRTNRGCRLRTQALQGGGGRGRAKPRRFSREEDRVIRAAMRERPADYGWAAECLGGGRTAVAVRERWLERLHPDNDWRKWTEKEDEVLRKVVRERGKDWAAAAKELPGRSRVRCLQRWFAIMPGVRSGPWTDEEDEVLLKTWDKLVEERGMGKFNFGHVAEIVGFRNRIQCGRRLKVLWGAREKVTSADRGQDLIERTKQQKFYD